MAIQFGPVSGVEIAEPIRSIQSAGGKISLLFRGGDVEVLAIEVDGGRSLSDASIWRDTSWHFALEGRVVLDVGDRSWEVLPSHWLGLGEALPYRIVNPGEERVRLLSIVCGPGAVADTEDRL